MSTSSSTRQALSTMYTGALDRAGNGLTLEAMLVLAEAFHPASSDDAAEAPLTPGILMQALAFALEEHHSACMAAEVQPSAYLARLEATRHRMRAATEQAWEGLCDALDAEAERLETPAPGEGASVLPLLTALHQALIGWTRRAGHA